MADVLVKNPITLEDLAQRIRRNLQNQGDGIRRKDLQDALCEYPEEGEAGVYSEQSECDAAVNILLERGLVREVDESKPDLPNWMVLRLNS